MSPFFDTNQHTYTGFVTIAEALLKGLRAHVAGRAMTHFKLRLAFCSWFGLEAASHYEVGTLL